jgi:hypothetical protein
MCTTAYQSDPYLRQVLLQLKLRYIRPTANGFIFAP